MEEKKNEEENNQKWNDDQIVSFAQSLKHDENIWSAITHKIERKHKLEEEKTALKAELFIAIKEKDQSQFPKFQKIFGEKLRKALLQRQNEFENKKKVQVVPVIKPEVERNYEVGKFDHITKENLNSELSERYTLLGQASGSIEDTIAKFSQDLERYIENNYSESNEINSVINNLYKVRKKGIYKLINDLFDRNISINVWTRLNSYFDYDMNSTPFHALIERFLTYYSLNENKKTTELDDGFFNLNQQIIDIFDGLLDCKHYEDHTKFYDKSEDYPEDDD